MKGGRPASVGGFGVCAVVGGRASRFSLLFGRADKGVVGTVGDGLIGGGRVGLLVLILLFAF